MKRKDKFYCVFVWTPLVIFLISALVQVSNGDLDNSWNLCNQTNCPSYGELALINATEPARYSTFIMKRTQTLQTNYFNVGLIAFSCFSGAAYNFVEEYQENDKKLKAQREKEAQERKAP